MRDLYLSTVVPVYNEAQNLAPLYHELAAVLDGIGKPFEMIFVDDGSRDGSWAELQKLHAADPRVKAIQFRRNFGQTAAFAAGFAHAQGELIVTLDADGQNDPADIPRLLEKLAEDEYDMVVGWRSNRKESFSRRFVSGIANRLISQSSQLSIHDRGCSLKLFRSDVVKSMRLYGQLHRFLPEMASVAGATVAEVPVNDRARKFGKSKYGALSRTPRVILDLFTVFFLLSFFGSPMRFFGYAGLASSALGFSVAGYLALAKIWHGLTGGWAGFQAYEIGNRPLLLLGALLVLVGLQFMMMGLLGEMIMRTYYEAQGKPIYAVRKILE
jgi:glycosyltransferase involved in cell wall biosynthesis